MSGGIYTITNIKNGKKYVGSAKNFEKRWKRHLKDLRSGFHSSIKLQRSYDLHGESSFHFEIIENMPYERDIIIEAENRYIAYFDSKANGYNIADASFGDTLTNHPNKDYIIEQRTVAQQKKIANLTPDERKAIWGHLGEANGMYGKTHSEEARKKMSQANVGNTRSRGRKVSEEHRSKISAAAKERIGDKNPFYGRKHTDASKLKMSKMHLGVQPPNTKIVVIDGVEYSGLTKASEATGVNFTTIAHRIRSSNPLYTGYLYKGEAKAPPKRRSSPMSKQCSVDGKIYHSVSLAAKELGISVSAMANRLTSPNYPDSFLI